MHRQYVLEGSATLNVLTRWLRGRGLVLLGRGLLGQDVELEPVPDDRMFVDLLGG